MVVEKAECLDADERTKRLYLSSLQERVKRTRAFTISEKSLAEDVETGDIIICNVNGQNEIDSLRVVFLIRKRLMIWGI